MLEGEDNMLPDVDNLSGALELQELVFWRQRGQPGRWYQDYSVSVLHLPGDPDEQYEVTFIS